MIESTENILQLAATLFCTLFAVLYAAKTYKRIWALLALASGVYFLGDLYWQLYLMFYGQTPSHTHIPYLGWYASYVFLLLQLLEIRGERPARPRSRLLWLIPPFTAGMAAFYLQWGDWLGNLVSAVLMGLLLWHTADCLSLWRDRADAGRRGFAASILLFCAAEYAAWTCSCFWEGDTLQNPYLWFDALLSVCFLIFPFALRRAVEE